MEYIKQLQEYIEKVKADKILHLRNQDYERAAACRDIEKQLQTQLEHANKVLTETNKDLL